MPVFNPSILLDEMELDFTDMPVPIFYQLVADTGYDPSTAYDDLFTTLIHTITPKDLAERLSKMAKPKIAAS